MCENFNRVFVYMLREFLKQTDPKNNSRRFKRTYAHTKKNQHLPIFKNIPSKDGQFQNL